MSVALSRIKRYLSSSGLPCAELPGDDVAILVDGGGAAPLMVHLSSTSAGIVQFRTINLIRAGDVRRRGALLKMLASSNLKFKLVKFAVDVSDGEVMAYIDLPIFDASPSEALVSRCVHAIRGVVLPMRRRVEALLMTGVDAGMPGPSLAAMGATLTMFQRIIEEAKGRASATTVRSVPAIPSSRAEGGGHPRGSSSVPDDDFASLVDEVLSEREKN